MTTETDLSSAEKKHLRGVAQTLQPAVSLGREGLTATVLEELETALSRDCLIKVKLPGNREERLSLAEAIALQTGATLVGMVGGKASFYRALPEAGEQSSQR